MLIYTSRAMVKEIKNKKFQIKNNIFETFKELTAQTPILYYYIFFLKQYPKTSFSTFP
jgi:hypothetical protein